MMRLTKMAMFSGLLLWSGVMLGPAVIGGNLAAAQDTEATPRTDADAVGTDGSITEKSGTEEPADDESVKEKVQEFTEQTQQKANELAESIDKDPRAHEVSAGILRPIYQLAEAVSFSSFHWTAFMFMTIGVVSFALQLVLGKLVVLARAGFSLKEILSDAVGLVISLIGLILTTQAAAENSTFTESPAAVLSATVAGCVGGFVLYLWGQSQEVQAAKGRTLEKLAESHPKK